MRTSNWGRPTQGSTNWKRPSKSWKKLLHSPPTMRLCTLCWDRFIGSGV